ncbi:MAG: sugar ABC transporter permease [Thermotoga sp.]|nr:MAG: sugar ABC transporter permease [Thermotoga sp.]HDM70077.1 sugar ABC transporter permease [Thermotogales bacterium]
MKKIMSDRTLVLLFILPTILLLVFIVVYPLIWSLFLSFTDYSVVGTEKPHFVGIRNFAELISDKYIWLHFRNTAKYTVMAVAIQFFLGLGIALLLNREFMGRGILLTLMLAPMMLSPIVVGLFWRYILDANWGVLNYFLSWFKIGKIAWLGDEKTAMISLVIVDTWMWTPFMILISLAGLSAIPKELYEAAEVDRASAWFRFRHITLPLISPLLLIGLLFRTMDAFKMFDLAWGLTQGGPGTATSTISIALYRMAFQNFETGKSCAFAYIILIIIIGMSNIYINLLNRIQARGGG